MSLKIESLGADAFKAIVVDFFYEEIHGRKVHEAIGPIWYWVGRYMERQADDCPSFWNIYTNSSGNSLAIEWRQEGNLQYIECRRVVVRDWKPQQ